MKSVIRKHKHFWAQEPYIVSTLIGAILLAISLLALYFANLYVSFHASNSVSDIILDHIPVINVNFLFSEGALIFLVILLLVNLLEPRHIPFVLKGTALFIVARCFFMILTHTAPPIHMSYLDPTTLIYKLSSGDDLFFSFHTGLPFFMALVFWDEKYLRYFFIFSAIVGATVVLLGHLHYSIDVFSALFISYGVFQIAKYLFPKDFLFYNPKR